MWKRTEQLLATELGWLPQKMRDNVELLSDERCSPFAKEARKCEVRRLLARIAAELPKAFYPWLPNEFRMPSKKTPYGATLALTGSVKTKERRHLEWWKGTAEVLRMHGQETMRTVPTPVVFEAEHTDEANKAIVLLVPKVVGLLSRPSYARISSILLMGKKQATVSMQQSGPLSTADGYRFVTLFAYGHVILLLDIWRRNSQVFLTPNVATRATPKRAAPKVTPKTTEKDVTAKTSRRIGKKRKLADSLPPT